MELHHVGAKLILSATSFKIRKKALSCWNASTMTSFKSIRLDGATGIYMDHINGEYDATGDYINEVPTYKHRLHKDSFLIFDKPRRKWKVRRADLDGKTIAKFFCENGVPLDKIFEDAKSSQTGLQWVVKDGIRKESYRPAVIDASVIQD